MNEDLKMQYIYQIDCLQKEVKRLNDELSSVKTAAFKAKLSDPNFDKKISEIDVTFEIVDGNFKN